MKVGYGVFMIKTHCLRQAFPYVLAQSSQDDSYIRVEKGHDLVLDTMEEAEQIVNELDIGMFIILPVYMPDRFINSDGE